MKFFCLGYMDEKKWDAMSKSDQEAMMDECLQYDEVLGASGIWGSGEGLQSTRTAKTLRAKGGKLLISDGPYAETKEQLGGFGILEARDMDHAVELMSKHPGVRLGGPFEIRPLDEAMTKRCNAAEKEPGALTEGKKFICLAYGHENNWNVMSESEREAFIEECIAYDEVLLKQGHWEGGGALQSAATAKTLRSRAGKVLVTDGPYAETKEQLGGVATFKFRNMDHAIESWAKHPCLRIGDALEIRPGDEAFSDFVAARLAAANSK